MNSTLFKRLIAHFLDHVDEKELEDGTTTYEIEGLLERDEPLTFSYHGHQIRAWVYRRYNASEVLYIEASVGTFDNSHTIHRFITTSTGKLPFATVYVDKLVDDEKRVHVVCSHSLMATDVTSKALGEILGALTYSAERAHQRLTSIEHNFRRLDRKDAFKSAALAGDDDESDEVDVPANTGVADDDEPGNEPDDETNDATDDVTDEINDSIMDDSDKFDDVKVATVHKPTSSDQTESILRELDELIGLEPVKAVIRELAATHTVARLRRNAGLQVAQPSPHLVFTGNPGTGKTTVARLIGRLYKSLGMLSKGHVVETDRSGLVAAYMGQTALKTRKLCESALGGVLFIDEAYSLVGDYRDYGIEAIQTLLTFMEANRGDFVVVVAGYPPQMHEFIESNPGLRSRFDVTIPFPDFDNRELVEIFTKLAAEFDYTLDAEAQHALLRAIACMPRNQGFGNGREMRKLFHTAVRRQAQLIHGGLEQGATASALRSLSASAIFDTPTRQDAREQSTKNQTNGMWGYL